MLNLQHISIELQKDYSPLNKVSKQLIRKFYCGLINPSEKINELISLWKKEFEFVYGNVSENLSSNKKIKPAHLAELYGIDTFEGKEIQITELFMAIQTYLSLIVRIVAYKIINAIKDEGSEVLNYKRLLSEIMDGTYFKNRGIDNYCYVDWYSWIITEWDEHIELLVKDLVQEIGKYDSIPKVSEFIEYYNNDYIKEIYETILPKELRHALGEYYTPDWLAQYTVERAVELSSRKYSDARFLDPTCGSGTFLFKLLQEIKKIKRDTVNITNQVIGFDINPLAVLTAKTNYLISMVEFLDKEEIIHFPIYNFDVINSPVERNGYLEIDLNNGLVYKIPVEWIEKNTYYDYLNNISMGIYSENNNDDYKKLYNQMTGRSAEIVKILTSMIVNRIKGYLIPKVDMIVGNPPWVNWEYLPQEYRVKSAHLWKDYGLLSVKGLDLSFSKEDISVLITYLVIDKYLQENGYLAFVIKQGLFKSAQNGIGFRRFKVGEDGYDLKVLRVDDLSKIKVFENAATSTAILFIQKNQVNEYPVPYYMWEKKKSSKRFSLNSYARLKEIMAQVNIYPKIAMPAIKEDLTSIWITAKQDELDAIRGVLGANTYKARTGIFTGGANAVYWLEVLDKASEDTITISNINKRAKRAAKKIEYEIEREYVYPLVKGSDIKQWQVSTKAYILCPHTAVTKMKPVAEEVLQRDYPLTYKYLQYFKEDLNNRKGFAGWEKEIQKKNFHSILRVGEYTFAKYKVAWRYIASEFITAVISHIDDHFLGRKLMIPNEKVMYISTDDENEAYYLCGVLSSDPVVFCVKSYMNPTSISTHVLEKLYIPTFDPTNKVHLEISKLCKEGHQKENHNERYELLSEINRLVADLYSIDKKKMELLKDSIMLLTNKKFKE